MWDDVFIGFELFKIRNILLGHLLQRANLDSLVEDLAGLALQLQAALNEWHIATFGRIAQVLQRHHHLAIDDVKALALVANKLQRGPLAIG